MFSTAPPKTDKYENWNNDVDTSLKSSKCFSQTTILEPYFQKQPLYPEELWWYRRSWYCVDYLEIETEVVITASNPLCLHKCVSCVWLLLPGCLQDWAVITEGNYFVLHVGRMQGRISTPPANFTLKNISTTAGGITSSRRLTTLRDALWTPTFWTNWQEYSSIAECQFM